MNYYLALIKTKETQYYELVKAKTLAEAIVKIDNHVPHALYIEVTKAIE